MNEYILELIEFHKAEGDSMAEIIAMFENPSEALDDDELAENLVLAEALKAYAAFSAALPPRYRTKLQEWALVAEYT